MVVDNLGRPFTMYPSSTPAIFPTKSYDLRQKLSFTPANNQGGNYQRGGYGGQRGRTAYQGGGGYSNQKFTKPQGFNNQNRFQPLGDQGNVNSEGGQKTEYTAQQILQSMTQDMEEWIKTNMWPFSCYAFLKDMPSFPGFDDLSPEEVRLKAYESEARGTGQSYRTWYNDLVNQYASKKNQIVKPTVPMKVKLLEAVESLQKVAKSNESTSSGQSLFGNMGGFGSSSSSAPKGFFSSSGTGQQTGGSVFGGANQPVDLSKGLFSQSSTNHSTGGSLFGGGSGFSQTPDQSKGLFGNSSTNQNTGSAFTSGVNQTVDQSKGLFGNITANQNSSGSSFGNSNAQAVDQSKGLFGTASTTQQQPTGLFGKPNASTSVFGNTAAQSGNQTATPFGNQTTTNNTLFGGASQTGFQSTSSGGFGNNTSTTGGTTGLFGKPAISTQAGTSGFGLASGDGSAQPSSSQTGNPSSSTTSQPQSGMSKSGLYTALSKLTTEERSAFEAPKFVLGKIPTRPPPRELV